MHSDTKRGIRYFVFAIVIPLLLIFILFPVVVINEKEIFRFLYEKIASPIYKFFDFYERNGIHLVNILLIFSVPTVIFVVLFLKGVNNFPWKDIISFLRYCYLLCYEKAKRFLRKDVRLQIAQKIRQEILSETIQDTAKDATAKQDDYVQPVNKVKKKKRPVMITIICIITFITAIIILPEPFYNYKYMTHNFGDWYPSFLVLATIGGIIGAVGLLRMKKWAAYIYIGIQVVGFFVAYNEQWIKGAMYSSLLFSALGVEVVLYHLKKMD